MAESVEREVDERYPAAEMVTALTGRGVTGQVDGRNVVIGSHTYFEDHFPHAVLHCDEARAAAAKGQTPLMVGLEGAYLGTITVADAVRDTSRAAIEQLRANGLNHVVMLTGDNQATAQAVADRVGVTEFRADLLPEHKVSAIEDLQQSYGQVAMVGDGINDAPALATATVGIAIGGATGTTQAMETADITLMGEDLRQLPFVFKLSQSTMRTIWLNVLFSIGIKLIFVILVLLGVGTMWMAVVADVATSLLVTLNGMRLLRWPTSPIGRH
jgi:Cd2+/Zn2+-exporting ATPase